MKRRGRRDGGRYMGAAPGPFKADVRGVGKLGLGLGLLRKRTISWCFAPKKPRTDR
jgi:hypothetical protein